MRGNAFVTVHIAEFSHAVRFAHVVHERGETNIRRRIPDGAVYVLQNVELVVLRVLHKPGCVLELRNKVLP